MLEESEERVTVLRVGTQHRVSSKVGSCQRVVNLERESCEHLGWIGAGAALH